MNKLSTMYHQFRMRNYVNPRQVETSLRASMTSALKLKNADAAVAIATNKLMRDTDTGFRATQSGFFSSVATKDRVLVEKTNVRAALVSNNLMQKAQAFCQNFTFERDAHGKIIKDSVRIVSNLSAHELELEALELKHLHNSFTHLRRKVHSKTTGLDNGRMLAMEAKLSAVASHESYLDSYHLAIWANELTPSPTLNLHKKINELGLEDAAKIREASAFIQAVRTQPDPPLSMAYSYLDSCLIEEEVKQIVASTERYLKGEAGHLLIANKTEGALNSRAYYAKEGYKVFADPLASSIISTSAEQTEAELLTLLSKIQSLGTNSAFQHNGDTKINLKIAEDSIKYLLQGFNETNLPTRVLKPASELSLQEAQDELALLALRESTHRYPQRLKIEHRQRERDILSVHSSLQPQQNIRF